LRLSEAVGRVLAETPQVGTLALVVGPEGGIEPAEIERLTAAGARCVTLGRRILRTETAGLCALAVVMSALGEM
jgi:16S rRNA (uracil1498-N3)-methyltransferase